MHERTGSRIVMEALEREGVDVIFGYPGGVVLPLYDEMLQWPEIKHVLVRHEQGAAHMADGYARATGRVGVCLATSGPGATNLVTGIATAMMDSVPMVAITGQVNSWAVGTDAFQEIDIQGITLPITKHNYLVTDPDELPSVMAEAFHLARTGRKGPVHVDITKDVFLGRSEAEFPEDPCPRGYLCSARMDMESIREAARLIAEAERPVIVAGAGVIWSDAAPALMELARKCDIPVANSLLGLGSISRDDERSIGMMGMHGEAAATMAVQKADLVLGIGIRYDDRLTGKVSGFAPNAKRVHFDVDRSEFGKAVTPQLVVPGNLSETLPALAKEAKAAQHAAWWSTIREWQEAYPLVVPESSGMLARHVITALNSATKGQAIVSTDVGQHQMWTAQLYRFQRPRQLLSSGGLGTMGYGFPAAMGASFAFPEQEVWAVVGDGGFQMTFQELQPAIEHNLNLKICLVNNGFLGMVRQWQELFYDNRHSHVAMGNPDYELIAKAYGVGFVRCSRKEDLAEAFAKAQSIPGPVLCEFLVDMEENVFPMVAAGASNDSLVHDPALAERRQEANGTVKAKVKA